MRNLPSPRHQAVHPEGLSELHSKARNMHRQDTFLAVATELFEPCSLALHCLKHSRNQVQEKHQWSCRDFTRAIQNSITSIELGEGSWN